LGDDGGLDADAAGIAVSTFDAGIKESALALMPPLTSSGTRRP